MCYTYDATYKDRLSGFGEESIGGYDLQGRPTNYRGMSLEWTHGRVSKFTKGGFTQTCTYDANGIRTEKIENGKTHKYYVEDSQIVREVVTGSENYELYYLYGANGIAGFTHKTANGSTTYYYRKNLQGDIVEIYKDNGTLCAEYAYDAWGNCTVNSDMGGIAALNPIRYRGYYWDEEIALYYLNARYYDPEVGRFISQDSIKYLAPETLNGINLFAYCLNNPVMETDPDGTWSWEGFGTILAIATAVAVGVALTFVTGGLAGAILGGAALGFAASATEDLISQVSTKGWDNVDYGQVWKEGGIGAAVGAISGCFAYGFGEIASIFGKQAGLAFSQTAHIGSGITFGKVFGTSTLMTLGYGAGKVLGTIAGAALGEYYGNKLFGRNYMTEDFDGTVVEELFGLLYDFMCWGLS